MRTFGDTVRLLMARRGLTGAALSREIELSKTSISKILQGHSKPKQVTFSLLMKALCTTPEEEQMMLKGFTGEAYELPELIVEETETNEAEVPSAERDNYSQSEYNRQMEVQRAERYLEMKTQSIAFKRSVARELNNAGISYEQDYCEGIYSTDFLIERDGQRLALECKFNVHRDMEKAVTVAEILLEKLSCDQVSIIVPFLDPTSTVENSRARDVFIETIHEFTKRFATRHTI